jgi:hypothetical protein
MSERSVQTTETDQLDLTNLDSVVKSILHKFADRADFGKKKYGTDLDRTDLKTLDWINHAQEELMDGILYLEKLKRNFSDNTG